MQRGTHLLSNLAKQTSRSFATLPPNAGKAARPRFVYDPSKRYAPERDRPVLDQRPGWEKHRHDLGDINPLWKVVGTVLGGTVLSLGWYFVTQSMHVCSFLFIYSLIFSSINIFITLVALPLKSWIPILTFYRDFLYFFHFFEVHYFPLFVENCFNYFIFLHFQYFNSNCWQPKKQIFSKIRLGTKEV